MFPLQQETTIEMQLNMWRARHLIFQSRLVTIHGKQPSMSLAKQLMLQLVHTDKCFPLSNRVFKTINTNKLNGIE